MELVHKKLVNVIAELAKFADTYKNLPTLAFTHFQPAQPTTVGKRATLWAQEFIMDLEDLEYVMGSLKLLGSKGTTGTQASFLELFDGDQETIDKIDPMIAAKMGFKECYAVSEEPDRIFCHGIQTQSDAFRAYRILIALCHDRCFKPGDHFRNTVV